MLLSFVWHDIVFAQDLTRTPFLTYFRHHYLSKKSLIKYKFHEHKCCIIFFMKYDICSLRGHFNFIFDNFVWCWNLTAWEGRFCICWSLAVFRKKFTWFSSQSQVSFGYYGEYKTLGWQWFSNDTQSIFLWEMSKCMSFIA